MPQRNLLMQKLKLLDHNLEEFVKLIFSYLDYLIFLLNPQILFLILKKSIFRTKMTLNQKSHSQLSEKLFIGLTTKPAVSVTNANQTTQLALNTV